MTTQTLTNEFLEKIKAKLEERKTAVEEQLESFAKSDPHQQGNYNSEFPQFGDKEDENASEVAVFESNLSLEETLEQSLEMINRSLKKIADGNYGKCEKCGQVIEPERLEIMPTATKCAPGACKMNHA
ncbi:MAG: TraR/DksA C4-type zinc finger protein [Candidatus Komeilibacteria bacterium]|nr:TraR/DksA C4-type zinc finger protein [Candidatus Komeilibacteria bacterium]